MYIVYRLQTEKSKTPPRKAKASQALRALSKSLLKHLRPKEKEAEALVQVDPFSIMVDLLHLEAQQLVVRLLQPPIQVEELLLKLMSLLVQR